MRARHARWPGRLAVPKDPALSRNVTPQTLRYADRVDQTAVREAVVTEDGLVEVSAAKIGFGKIATLKRHVYESGSAKIRARKVHLVQFPITKRLRDQMLLFAGRENRQQPVPAG